MGIFFVYILKSSVCLALFYLFYRVLLSKETFHRFNRVALLGVLALSCLIPFLKVTTHEISGIGQSFLSLEEMLMMAEMEPVGVVEEASKPFPWRALMLLVYVAGVLFFVLRHLWSLGRMLRLLRTARRENLEGGVILFVHRHKDVAPFSWMKYIAVSEADLEEARDVVLAHERAHIHNRHSWDLLLAEACVFLQWFNPAAWLLKQELQTVHEYEADEWVIENGVDARNYQLLIIKKAVGARLYSIANSFNHSSLKKRITMMIKKKSNPWARMKCLVALPIAAVAVAAFARPEVSNELEEISSAKVNELVSVAKAIGEEKEDTLPKTIWYEVKAATPNDPEYLKVPVEEGKKPLLVVDGAPWPTHTLNDIDATMVESVTVIKGKEAVELYGEKAKDGAVIIVSKRTEEQIKQEALKYGVPMRESSDEKFNLSGQVMEYPAKKPVPGASVLIKGTTMGTLADKDGKFVLPVKKGDVLVVSYVGLQTQQLPVGGPANLVVWMRDDVQQLDEMVVVAQTPEKEVKYTEVKVEKTEEPQEKVIFQVVEEMPQFPGGLGEAMNFLAKNMKYPVEAQEAKIEGRVIVQFVVERDGSVSDVKVMRGVSPALDAEAVRVVSLMPKWIPGKQRGKAVAVKYTMPIMFRLQTPSAPEEEETPYNHITLKVDKDADNGNVDAVKSALKNRLDTQNVSVNGTHGESALIIVDGKELGHGAGLLSTIPVDRIQTISVLKNEAAKAEYGDKAKNGVIIVVTKKE